MWRTGYHEHVKLLLIVTLASTSLLYCYATEALPFCIRARELALQIAVSKAAFTINQCISPIAFHSIGSYHHIFYLGMLILGSVTVLQLEFSKSRTLF